MKNLISVVILISMAILGLIIIYTIESAPVLAGLSGLGILLLCIVYVIVGIKS